MAELVGPWRQEPLLLLDEAVIAEVDRVCREDPEFPSGVTLVLIDARGGGRLPAIFAGANAMADCLFLQVNSNGRIGGSLSGKGTVVPQPGAGQLTDLGGAGVGRPGEEGAWSSTSGRAGPEVASVIVDVAGVGPITATLENGWYLAWWPGAIRNATWVVTAFDALGTQTDQVLSK